MVGSSWHASDEEDDHAHAGATPLQGGLATDPFVSLIYFREAQRGGDFPAWDEPQLFAPQPSNFTAC